MPAGATTRIGLHPTGAPLQSSALTADESRDRRYSHFVLFLVVPTIRLHEAWLDAYQEWGPGLHEDGFGVLQSDDVISATGFSTWVARIADCSQQATCRWIVEGGRVLGGIALRHGPSEYVEWAGHVGFGIRPTARRRGVATWALRQTLDGARELGMDQLLLVCAADNVASVNTIQRVGGVLEGVSVTPYGPTRRYWVKLTGSQTVD